MLAGLVRWKNWHVSFQSSITICSQNFMLSAKLANEAMYASWASLLLGSIPSRPPIKEIHQWHFVIGHRKNRLYAVPGLVTIFRSLGVVYR